MLYCKENTIDFTSFSFWYSKYDEKGTPNKHKFSKLIKFTYSGKVTSNGRFQIIFVAFSDYTHYTNFQKISLIYSDILKLKYYEKATKFETIVHLFLLSSSVKTIQILWPFQKRWTLTDEFSIGMP